MRLIRLLILGFSVLLVACGDKEATDVEKEVIQPVKTIVIGAGERSDIRSFPASVDANQRAELAFRVSGKVVQLPVNEGQSVEQGRVLAKLDPKDYQITVRDRQATFDIAKANFDRASKLLPDGYISESDYDILRSKFLSAKAELDKAKLNLSYTVLKAPFAGQLSRRYIEVFEEVEAKQVVLNLSNPKLLELKLDLPENLVQQLNKKQDAANRADDINVVASFEGQRDKLFPLAFKEVATKADPKTQTFEVTFILPAPEEITVLPGMSATVTLDLTKGLATGRKGRYYSLPVSAVIGDNNLSGAVWIVEEPAMILKKRDIKVGTLKEKTIEVVSGLESGDRVVVAGVPFLFEGMRVRLMEDKEQADQ